MLCGSSNLWELVATIREAQVSGSKQVPLSMGFNMVAGLPEAGCNKSAMYVSNKCLFVMSSWQHRLKLAFGFGFNRHFSNCVKIDEFKQKMDAGWIQEAAEDEEEEEKVENRRGRGRGGEKKREDERECVCVRL